MAKLLDKKHIRQSVKAIYTSNHLRCKQTANIINQTFHVAIVEDARLNEFVSVENETWFAAQTRITNFLDELVEKFDEADAVICVTSGVNLAAFISKAYGVLPSEDIPFFGVPSCSPIIFDYRK